MDLLIIISSIFITLIAGLLIFVVYIRRKDRKRIRNLEQRLLLSQMNPHFVFNSLTAIQSYIFRNEPHMAGKYMSSFSKLVRLILENSRSELIPIRREEETLTHYLELQCLRFEGKFEYTIAVDENIDREYHAIPPMLAQPFIENAIEHGIIHLSEKGVISIRFLLQNNFIVLEVEDNGLGIDSTAPASQKKWKEYKSLATTITRERLSTLRESVGQRITMEIKDLKSEAEGQRRGTLVRFNIPIRIVSGNRFV